MNYMYYILCKYYIPIHNVGLCKAQGMDYNYLCQNVLGRCALINLVLRLSLIPQKILSCKLSNLAKNTLAF